MDVAETHVAITVESPERSNTGRGRDEPEPRPSEGRMLSILEGLTQREYRSERHSLTARWLRETLDAERQGRRGRRRGRSQAAAKNGLPDPRRHSFQCRLPFYLSRVSAILIIWAPVIAS